MNGTKERSGELARIAIAALEEKKATDIRVIDISEVSVLADYFIIANGSNRPQIQALSDEVSEKMEKAGARRNMMVAKIAGGAQMFAFQNKTDLVRVGDRNVEASKKALKTLGIPILAEDTGENFGRTVIFYPETGDYVIRAVGKAERTI